MILKKEELVKLKELSKPVIKFLNEFHPHCKIIIENNSAEFLENSSKIITNEFIKD